MSAKFTEDDIRDIAIKVTEELLDKHPHLLSTYVHEVDGQYTDGAWELQDAIFEAIKR